MSDREQVAAAMARAMSEFSEDRYAAGWLIGIETIVWRCDEDFAVGLRAIAKHFDVWPHMVSSADPAEDGAVQIEGWWYHLLTYDEAEARYGT